MNITNFSDFVEGLSAARETIAEANKIKDDYYAKLEAQGENAALMGKFLCQQHVLSKVLVDKMADFTTDCIKQQKLLEPDEMLHAMSDLQSLAIDSMSSLLKISKDAALEMLNESHQIVDETQAKIKGLGDLLNNLTATTSESSAPSEPSEKSLH